MAFAMQRLVVYYPSEDLTEGIHLIPTKSDPSLPFSFSDEGLIGINGSYLDDLIRAGARKFRKASQVTHMRFETSGDEELPLTFAGLYI